MKNSEIVELSTEEVISKINDEKATLARLKFAHTISAIENPMRIIAVRKNVARLNTELTKRKLKTSGSVTTVSDSE